MFVIFDLPTYSPSVIGGIKHSIALRSLGWLSSDNGCWQKEKV